MTDREHVVYTGDDPVYLPGWISPSPDLCEPADPEVKGSTGTVVEVDSAAVDGLVARGDFRRASTAEVEARPELSVEGLPPGGEPIPLDLQRAQLQASTAAGELSGQDLADALADAGLSAAGSESDKRARLAAWQDAQAAQLGTTGPIPVVPAATPTTAAPAASSTGA